MRYGYAQCNDASFEDGVTKVAMYLDEDGLPTHFARQVEAIEGDKWTSKLGDAIDIVHDDLACIVCKDIGKPTYYYRKDEPRAKWPPRTETTNTANS